MAKKAIVELELQTDSYKASLVEIQKGNTTISESASKAAQTAQAAFTETGKAAKAAFASTEVKKALTDQTAGIDKLAASLQKLIQEQVDLLAAGKKQSDEFKKNQAEIARVNGEIAKLTKQTEQLATAEDKTTKKSQTLTAQLRAMKLELSLLEQEGKDGTAQFNQLSLAAARLEDQIGDTRERVRVLASDTFAFDAAVDSVNVLAGGFAAVQGAVGLFAEDNEELQKAIAKTNSALAILNGLQQINAFFTGQSAGKLAILSGVQAAYTAVVGTSTGALKAFRLALAATGIGLLVLGLVALVQNFDKVKKAFSDFNNSKPENGFLQIGKAILNTVIAPINLLIKGIEKIQSLVSDEKQIDKNKGLTDRLIKQEERRVEAKAAAIDREIALAEAQNKDTFRLEIEKEKLFLDFAKRKLKILTDNEKLIRQAGIDTSDLQFDLQQEILDRENAIDVLRLKNKREVKKQIEEIETKNFQLISKLTDAEKKKLQELNKIRVQSLEEQIAIESNVLQRSEIIQGSTLQRRLRLIELEGAARKKQAQDNIKDQQEQSTAIQLIEAETQAAIRAERKKTLDESVNLAFEYAQQFAAVLTSLNELSRQTSENTIAEIQQRQAAELEAINNTLDTERQKERQRAALTLRTNQQIALEKQKQAKRDKALAIFEATINTAASIVKTGAQLGYPAAIPFQVAAGIVGAAQIATIAARPIPRFEKGGKVGGKRHNQGGTLIEAEVDEFVTRRGQSIRHRSELEAINRSTAEYHRLIQRNYVRPAIARVLADRKQDKPTFNLNATLNSKKMEGELKGLRKDIRRSKQRNYTNQTDSRYQWHNK